MEVVLDLVICYSELYAPKHLAKYKQDAKLVGPRQQKIEVCRQTGLSTKSGRAKFFRVIKKMLHLSQHATSVALQRIPWVLETCYFEICSVTNIIVLKTQHAWPLTQQMCLGPEECCHSL